MTLALASLRAALTPPWVRDDLWRRARAVPSLDLRFADNKSLTDSVTGASLVTFTRAGNGTYTDSAGVLQTAATDVPRFDHNPTTGESLGLLVEEARTNLIFQSQDLTTSWTPAGVTVTSNVAVAPDGTTTADKITYANGASYAEIRSNSWTDIAGTTTTFSCYLKNAGATYATLRISLDNNRRATFNLATGAVTGVQAGVAAYEMKNVGNGWYRCSVTGIAPSSQYGYSSVFDSFGGIGNGVDGVYVWGAQQEVGAFPTSYIPTTTATVTRAADVVSMTGTNFSSWYRQDEGTWLGAISTIAGSSGRLVEVLGPSGFSTSIRPRASSSRVDFARQGSGTAQITGVTFPVKIAGAYNSTALQGAVRGTLGSAVTSGSLVNSTSVEIGAITSETSYLGGTIARLAYWPTRLGESTLPALTQ